MWVAPAASSISAAVICMSFSSASSLGPQVHWMRSAGNAPLVLERRVELHEVVVAAAGTPPKPPKPELPRAQLVDERLLELGAEARVLVPRSQPLRHPPPWKP